MSPSGVRTSFAHAPAVGWIVSACPGPHVTPSAEYAQPIVSAGWLSYTANQPPPGAGVTIGFSMNVRSIAAGLYARSRVHGPPSDGAEARPTSQCVMGSVSLFALP